MKKSMKALMACALACTLTVQVPSVAYAADTSASIFTKSAVTKLINQAKNQTVVADKVATKVASKKLTSASSATVLAASSSSSSGSTTTGTSGKTITGTYPTRKGVIIVTSDAYKNILPTGHAGIVYSATSCIESLQDGVQFGKNDFNTRYASCYGCTVKGTTAAQDAATVDYIINKKWVGKKYNWNYLNVSTRDKFYCSHLVWAAYKDNLGIDLNTSKFGNAVHPMELVDTDKTSTIYKQV